MNALEKTFRLTFEDCRLKGNFGSKYDQTLAKFIEKTKVRYKGESPHRYGDNPREKLWALFFDTWCQKNSFQHLQPRRGSLDWLLGKMASENEFKVAASVFQHMGSPVGHFELIQLLCTLSLEDKEEIVKQLKDSIACQDSA